MEMKERLSGLVVPMPPAQPPKRSYGPLEIQHEELREQTKEVLTKLWHAMGLHESTGGIRILGNSTPKQREAQYQLFMFFSEMLLGEDLPSMEQLT